MLSAAVAVLVYTWSSHCCQRYALSLIWPPSSNCTNKNVSQKRHHYSISFKERKTCSASCRDEWGCVYGYILGCAIVQLLANTLQHLSSCKYILRPSDQKGESETLHEESHEQMQERCVDAGMEANGDMYIPRWACWQRGHWYLRHTCMRIGMDSSSRQSVPRK